jgi:putative sterol carrier protein
MERTRRAGFSLRFPSERGIDGQFPDPSQQSRGGPLRLMFLAATIQTQMTLPFTFPSAEWCEACRTAVNASEAYRTSAREWTHGPVALVIDVDATLGLGSEAVWIDSDRGECRECVLVSHERAGQAAFVLQAPYSRWKEVLRKQVDPTKAMMQNKLKLSKGHMPTAVRFVTSNKALVEAAASVPTRFVDDPEIK